MKSITYVTGNWTKIASAKQVLDPLGIEIDNVNIDTPEIQANDVSDVAMYSAKWAAEELKKPVIKNDTGLFIKGLNEFPGVYMHYIHDTLGVDGLLKLMEGIENRDAYLKESIAYCEPGGEPIVFEGITNGKIAFEKSGKYAIGVIDYIFIPDGETKTLGNFPNEKRWSFWSPDAYTKLAKYLNDYNKE